MLGFYSFSLFAFHWQRDGFALAARGWAGVLSRGQSEGGGAGGGGGAPQMQEVEVPLLNVQSYQRFCLLSLQRVRI